MPGVIVNEPSSGDIWTPQSTQTIEWVDPSYSGASDTWTIKLYNGVAVEQTICTYQQIEPVLSNFELDFTLLSSIGGSGTNYRIHVKNEGNTGPQSSDYSDYISIGAPTTLTIDEPNGGESWYVGDTHDIEWSHSGGSGTVDLVLFKGGFQVEEIASGITNDDSYSWEIAEYYIPGTDYTIYIRDSNNAAISDFSNSSFTLLQQTITVLSPNGGEDLTSGENHTITWTSAGGSWDTADIRLYRGTNLVEHISDTGNDGSYVWMNILDPGEAHIGTDVFNIRVSKNSDLNIYDESDSNFSINYPNLAITSPNTNVSWQTGTTHNITWDPAGVTGNIKLELWKYSGWNSDIADNITNNGTYSWDIPAGQSESSGYRIKIISLSNEEIDDLSDVYFSIYRPDLTITSPNGLPSWFPGAQTLLNGTTHTITWNSEGTMSNVAIYLYKGNSLNEVIEAGVSNLGEYDWEIEDITPASNYKIRIVWTQSLYVSDYSNYYFSIQSPPPIPRSLSDDFDIDDSISTATGAGTTESREDSSFFYDIINKIIRSGRAINDSYDIDDSVSSSIGAGIAFVLDTDSAEFSETLNIILDFRPEIAQGYRIDDSISSSTSTEFNSVDDESFEITESLSEAVARLQEISDEIEIDDSTTVTTIGDSNIPTSDAILFSEILTKAIKRLSSISDEFAIEDSISKSGYDPINHINSDSAKFTEILSDILERAESLSDNILIDDSTTIIKFDESIESTEDSMELSEILSESVVRLRELIDIAGIEDTIDIELIISSIISESDTAQFSNILVKIMERVELLSDELGIEDNTSITIPSIFTSSAIDNVLFTEILSKAIGRVELLSDELGIKDNTSITIPNIFTSSTTDFIEFNDVLSKIIHRLKSLSDEFNVEDNIIGITSDATANLADGTIEFIETLIKAIERRESLSDEFNIDDSAITDIIETSSRSVSDSVLFTEELNKFTERVELLHEDLLIEDTTNISLDSPIDNDESDSMGLSELLVKIIERLKLLSDNFSIDEQVEIDIDSPELTASDEYMYFRNILIKTIERLKSLSDQFGIIDSTLASTSDADIYSTDNAMQISETLLHALERVRLLSEDFDIDDLISSSDITPAENSKTETILFSDILAKTIERLELLSDKFYIDDSLTTTVGQPSVTISEDTQVFTDSLLSQMERVVSIQDQLLTISSLSDQIESILSNIISDEININELMDIIWSSRHSNIYTSEVRGIFKWYQDIEDNSYANQEKGVIGNLGGNIVLPLSSLKKIENINNKIITKTSPTNLNNSLWEDESAHDNLPDKVNCIHLDYHKKKGNPGSVYLTVKDTTLIKLDKGDNCVMPLGGDIDYNRGYVPGDIKIHVDNYTSTDKAYLNLKISGTQGLS